MIDFVIKLEDMLRMSGYTDWEIRYIPESGGCILKLDDHVVFLREIKEDDNA